MLRLAAPVSSASSRLRAVVVAALAAHLVLPTAARAETYPLGDVRIEIPTDPARAACFDRAGGDVDMARCEDGEAAAWDRRLNAAWARLRATLPPAEFQCPRAPC
jgi:uncharacterized protein YecT (DUF1311 family)